MTRYNYKKLNTLDRNFPSDLKLLIHNNSKNNSNLHSTVSKILKKVEKGGDQALLNLVKKCENFVCMLPGRHLSAAS